MNITIISNNYYPEDSGIGLYSSDMAEFLAINNKVTVITGFPYYPQWQIHSKYKAKTIYFKEVVNNVTVYRFKQFTPKKPKFLNRIVQMVHFFFGSIYNVFKIQKSDVIIVVIPFTISILLGLLIKLLKGGKIVIHIQDFEFDAAFETGLASKKKLLFNIVTFIEKTLLNKASFISTISIGMLEKLQTKTKKETCYFPNWIDYKKINPATKKPFSIYKTDKFNILYSGNIGAKQDWDFFIEFAIKIQSIPNAQIILIGDGAKKDEVIKKTACLKNVTYLPPVKYEVLNDVLCGADLHILFQKPTVIDTVMPSKILGMMASEIISIVTGHENSEVKHNFKISKGGYYYYQEDKLEKIFLKIKKLIELKGSVSDVGKNARLFVIENFSKNKVLFEYEKKLLTLKN